MKAIYFAVPSLILAACASQPVDSGIPAALVPADGKVVERFAARGVQIYECKANAAGGQAWAFVAPEAELFDAQGRPAGKHYAGPHWEALDGSKIVGTTKSRFDAPDASAIPWLLLDAKSVGPNGRFSKVTSVQRINTAGGLAPATQPCDAKSLGAKSRVSYTADYVLLAPTAAAY
jgi:hypothetical protein